MPNSSSASDLQRLLARKLVAVIRTSGGDELLEVAEALLRGGVEVLEVTFTVPGAERVLERLADRLGDRILLGAGTVLDSETARIAILAGARFIVSPVLSLPVIELCRRYGKLALPGAFTPTEVLAAWEAGADIVKIFPAEIAGPAYFKALRGPLPQVRLMPTGGVSLQTIPAFLQAGACALGIGTGLVDPKLVAARDFLGLEALAQKHVAALNGALS